MAVDGAYSLCCFLKYTISSFVLFTLRERLFSWHHSARGLTSSLLAVSSLLVIRPTTIVSSANLIELEACVATQSWVNREYRRGLSMHPCGAPLLRFSEVVSYLQHLGAARQEVQDPVVQGWVQTQGPELKVGGYYGVEG